ncbi:hypothetical protein AKO1_002689 [Acrasis kona]|uniref:Uncharacterized protein n=1 Tax=Acrasis kona TaxID=1008807 RepID=A0AAW2ZI36_9EUKA
MANASENNVAQVYDITSYFQLNGIIKIKRTQVSLSFKDKDRLGGLLLNNDVTAGSLAWMIKVKVSNASNSRRILLYTSFLQSFTHMTLLHIVNTNHPIFRFTPYKRTYTNLSLSDRWHNGVGHNAPNSYPGVAMTPWVAPGPPHALVLLHYIINRGSFGNIVTLKRCNDVPPAAVPAPAAGIDYLSSVRNNILDTQFARYNN